MIFKLKDVAKLVKGELIGDGDIEVKGVNGIREAGKGDLTFILHSRYADLMKSTRASAVIIPNDLKGPYPKPVIKAENPSISFSRLIDTILPDRIPHPKGIHPAAIVAKRATLGGNVALGPYVVIEEGASIGDNTAIYPFSYVGKDARIGASCVIYTNVSIREEVTIGDRVIIHSGSVIGSDGFGYDTQKDGKHVKIPQLGTVVIEDDVEIGACVTVDRARLARTVIGKGSKIDNLVQIGHNVIVGPNCMMAAQTGISGSSELGRNVVLAGQVGIVDHVKLGDFVKVGAQSGVTKSHPPKTVLFGYPAKPADKARELIASVGLLPKLFERVKALEDKIEKLEK